MTSSNGPETARGVGAGRRGALAALSWAALTAGTGAVFAWAACCVLPMTLATTGLGLGGLSWLAGLRTSITLVALGVVGVGWLLHWLQTRQCHRNQSCALPSRLGTVLLLLASALVLLALVWRPLIEPWALALMRGAG